MGFKPFALQGEALRFEFPPTCESLCHSELYGRTASQPLLLALDVGFFFALCEGFPQLVFRFFSEEMVPYVAVHLGCPWEEVSSESDIASLNKNSLYQMLSHRLLACN